LQYRFHDRGDTVFCMFSFLEGPELIIVVVLVLLVFGGSQLPKLAKNLGQAQNEFKKGLDAGKDKSEAAAAPPVVVQPVVVQPPADAPKTDS
jgi:sec-independent protein translocase protein TatA